MSQAGDAGGQLGRRQDMATLNVAIPLERRQMFLQQEVQRCPHIKTPPCIISAVLFPFERYPSILARMPSEKV